MGTRTNDLTEFAKPKSIQPQYNPKDYLCAYKALRKPIKSRIKIHVICPPKLYAKEGPAIKKTSHFPNFSLDT